MRRFLIAAAASVAMLATPALAQHRTSRGAGHWQGGGQMHDSRIHGGWQGQRGGSWHWTGPGQRWGGTIDDRWYGGAGAPGGWSAYRRPVRGEMLPLYWVSPSWTVWDWADYGLPRPPRGYNWSRYYDDAVLIDRSGQVRDSRGDVDWGGYDQGYDDGYRDGYDDASARDRAAPPGYDQRYDGPPPEVRFGPRTEIVQPLDGPALAYPPHVVTRCVGDCAGVVADGYYYPPRTESTITIPARPAVVTTTTTAAATPQQTYRGERAAPGRTKTVARKTVTRTTSGRR